ncbi:MAG: CarD family transcriptional regulator [Clostridiales bacterium]|nr:CarD family transcriptional regulator [Clostridiales bacterium]
MFQVNDIVVYGKHGVCKVTDVGTLSMSMVDKDELYYTLRPVYQKDAVIYAPIENNKTVMRSVISKQEAKKLINEIDDIETVRTGNEQEREAQYRVALRNCDCRELVKIIKTLYLKNKSRTKSGKKAMAVDERYFRLAENQLNEELAYVLGMNKEEVTDYIANCVSEKKVTIHT